MKLKTGVSRNVRTWNQAQVLWKSRQCFFFFLTSRAISGGQSKNDPHRLTYLSALSSGSGTIWKGLRGVALLEEGATGDGL